MPRLVKYVVPVGLMALVASVVGAVVFFCFIGSHERGPGKIEPGVEVSLSPVRTLGFSDVTSVAFTPDGQFLALASFSAIHILDCSQWLVVRTLEGHAAAWSVAWSPGGEVLATGHQDGSVILWNPATGAVTRTLRGHPGIVGSLAWSPDGTLLASGSSKPEGAGEAVKLWDPVTGEELHSWVGPRNGVYSISWTPDGSRLAMGSRDGLVSLWDPATGEETGTLVPLLAFTAKVSVAWNPDGTQLAIGSARVPPWASVQLWDPTTEEFRPGFAHWMHGPFERFHTWYAEYATVAWSPDGGMLAFGCGSVVSVWDVAARELIHSLRGHTDVIYSLAWSPDGTIIVSASADKSVKLWNMRTGEQIRSLRAGDPGVQSLAWSPNGRMIAVAHHDGTVNLWDSATGARIKTIEGWRGYVASSGVAWSPDGKVLAFVSRDNTVRLLGPTTGEEILTLSGHTGTIRGLAWSPDGKILASFGPRETKLWNPRPLCFILALLGQGQEINTLGGATSVAWSPDGEVLALGYGYGWGLGSVRLLNPHTGRQILTLKGHEGLLTSVAWDPDGTIIASGGSEDETVRLWDPATGRELSSLSGHDSGVLSVAFSPDGKVLASGSWYGVKLWDPATGEEIRTLGTPAGVRVVAWCPDGRALALGLSDGTVRLLDK